MNNILIVDDSTITLRTVSAQLRRSGFAPIAAETVSRARRHLATGSIDLVILDMGSPSAGGLALLFELRRKQSYRNLPVVVLSASGSDIDRAQARAAGATTFLSIPFSTNELCETVTRVLAMAGYAGPLSGSQAGQAAPMRTA